MSLGLPAERDGVLALIAPERRRIYTLVRSVLDDLETAAPWHELYDPADDRAAFLEVLDRLATTVEAIPDRVSATIADLGGTSGLDEIEFYFEGIHQLAARDLARLRQRIQALSRDTAPALHPTERDPACEVAADLKGKYASAMMGATASIVAEGLWTGVEIEPILFPEKVEEFARNAELERNLREINTDLTRLTTAVPFRDVLTRWQEGKRVDPYALVELTVLRGSLGRLLQQRYRRALYSGDYRQIRRRERTLSQRLNTLEDLQGRTWSSPPGTNLTPLFGGLVELLREVLAIVDVELLQAVIGDRQVRDLRQVAASEREEEKRRGGSVEDLDETETRRRAHPRRQRLAADIQGLVTILHEEDLRTFFDLLLGSVLKRASLSLRPQSAAPPELAAELADLSAGAAVTAAVAPEVVESLAPLPTWADDPPAPGPPPAGPPPARKPTPPPTPVPVAPPAPVAPVRSALPSGRPAARAPLGPREREAIADLRRVIEHLRANDNPHWNAFRIIQRLLAKHSAVPPPMLLELHPYVHDLLNGLMPKLDAVRETGLIPEGAITKLVHCCTELTRRDLSLEKIRSEVPGHLERVTRLLDALEATTAAAVERTTV